MREKKNNGQNDFGKVVHFSSRLKKSIKKLACVAVRVTLKL
jgi:hypothetical protein